MPWGTSARAHRLPAAFGVMLRAALEEPGGDYDWLLFLEDDLDFHPHIAKHVSAWEPLIDNRCGLASLFNPALRALAKYVPWPNSFAAEPSSFLGAQALLLRRAAAKQALSVWRKWPGMTSQRLARLLENWQPYWVHKPSLVQHVATDSSWGTRVQRALDFNPAWEP